VENPVRFRLYLCGSVFVRLNLRGINKK